MEGERTERERLERTADRGVPRVVASVATVPPVSGQAVATRVLQEGLGALGVEMEVLSLNPPRSRVGAGGKVAWYALHLTRLTRLLGHRAGEACVYYLQAASSPSGALRDAALLSVARVRGVPWVLHVHCSGFAENLRGLRAPLRQFLRACLREASAVVVLDPEEGRRIERQVPGCRVVVVPNGVEEVVVERGGALGPRRTVPTTPDEPFRVLFLAHCFPFKGYATVLEAARLAKERRLPYRFSLAGALPGALPGPAPVDLGVAIDPVRFVDEHALDSVELLGVVRDDAKYALLARSHAFCLPSHFEIQPLSILEAMHFALPVVSTAVGGIPEMLGDGPQRTLLVEPGDAEGLLARLERLRTDPAFYREVAHRLQARARTRFTPRAHAEAMLRLFEHAVAGARGGGGHRGVRAACRARASVPGR